MQNKIEKGIVLEMIFEGGPNHLCKLLNKEVYNNTIVWRTSRSYDNGKKWEKSIGFTYDVAIKNGINSGIIKIKSYTK